MENNKKPTEGESEDNPVDKCDKNNPNDPHYNDREQGDYNSSCVWIWDIGRSMGQQESK